VSRDRLRIAHLTATFPPYPGGAGNTTRGEGVRRGVGFAVGFKNICYSEGFDDFCAARVVLAADAAEIHCAAAEVGQDAPRAVDHDLAHGAVRQQAIERAEANEETVMTAAMGQSAVALSPGRPS